MNPPNISCTINVSCIINPSEDKSKLETALSNIIPDSVIKYSNSFLQTTMKNIYALEKIYETIHNKFEEVYFEIKKKE